MADNRVGVLLGSCDAAVLRCCIADTVVRTSMGDSVAPAVDAVGDDEVSFQYLLSASLPLSLSSPPPRSLPPFV